MLTNYSHLKYINILNNESYIFCEKPPVNKLSQYIKLKKIISKKKFILILMKDLI